MFDADLVLCDGSADWNYANLVTSNYGSPVLTTVNTGGFAVLDMLQCPYTGLAIVLAFVEAANAVGDVLTVIAEECADYDFSTSQPHELTKFDIAAAVKGEILGSEITAALLAAQGGAIFVVKRVSFTKRYIRIDASCTSSDDFGVVYCKATPFPFKVV